MSATAELRMSPKKRKPVVAAEQQAEPQVEPVPTIAPVTPPASSRKQYNVGLSLSLAAQIDELAEALGLDPTNFIRMALTENLAVYRKRVEAIRQAAGGEGKK